jgi:hypothetical protein
MDNDNLGSFVRVVTLGMRTTVHWFDPKWEAIQKSVDAALAGPRQPAQRQLRHRHDAGLLDRRRRSRHVALARPRLEVAEAVRRHQARDRSTRDAAHADRQLPLARRHRDPAYLTLPADGARNAPAVVLVHGGPVVRDRWAWNPEVQMLASRGYAVLQPQFRGSAGFGRKFESAGYGEWGRAMQDDVTAGAQWLAAQGFADPRPHVRLRRQLRRLRGALGVGEDAATLPLRCEPRGRQRSRLCCSPATRTQTSGKSDAWSWRA